MARHTGFAAACAAFALVLAGCASRGQAVLEPPAVRVSDLRSTSFTPDLVKFQARVLIENKRSPDMDFEKVDDTVDMFDTPLFSDSFTEMKRTHRGGSQTVTFPFQISMEDIRTQGLDVLSEEQLRIAFHGRVFAAASLGFDPLPFDATLTIPIPRIPIVRLLGTSGTPFSSVFRIRLGVTNPNPFPCTVDSIDSYLVLNDTKYSLLQTDDSKEIPAGGAGTIVLQMKTTPAKVLGLALNLVQSGDSGPKLDMKGSVTLRTPYGWVYVPVSLKEAIREGSETLDKERCGRGRSIES